MDYIAGLMHFIDSYLGGSSSDSDEEGKQLIARYEIYKAKHGQGS